MSIHVIANKAFFLRCSDFWVVARLFLKVARASMGSDYMVAVVFMDVVYRNNRHFHLKPY